MQWTDVHKFGGTSLADAARFAVARSILGGGRQVVVVSAISGVTDILQSLLETAKNNLSYDACLVDLLQKHLMVINGLPAGDRAHFQSVIESDIADLRIILKSIALIGQYSDSEQEMVLGYG